MHLTCLPPKARPMLHTRQDHVTLTRLLTRVLRAWLNPMQPAKLQKKLDAKKQQAELDAIRSKYGIEKKD